jgi:hypothetical protein
MLFTVAAGRFVCAEVSPEAKLVDAKYWHIEVTHTANAATNRTTRPFDFKRRLIALSGAISFRRTSDNSELPPDSFN